MAQNVFVTGATGFAGGVLARKLAEQGDSVRALARRTSNVEALKDLGAEVVYGDLANGRLPDGALRGIDTVYNVAAVYRKEGVPEHYFYDVHVTGTKNLLEAAQRANVARFVHFSTVGVHGNVKNPPATETAPFDPGDVYQRSKAAGERVAREFFAQHGLPGVVIRPAAIYGPGDRRFLKLFRSIDKGIFWMLGKGNVYYHLVYVDDLIDGVILAAQSDKAVGEAFIIAGDKYLTVAELVREISHVMHRQISARGLPISPVLASAVVCQKVCQALHLEPPLYPRRLDFFRKNRAFDITKAREVLGYSPKVSLESGLTCTAKWYHQMHLL